MSESEKGGGIGFVGATIAVVAIIVIALIARLAGLGSFVSLVGAVATVVGVWITLVQLGGNATEADQQWSRQPIRGREGSPQEPKSTEEYIELFKRDPGYTKAGKYDYPNKTVRICRALKRALSYLPIPEGVYRWVHRLEAPVAVLAYLWSIVYLGQAVDTLLPIESYPEIRSLLYVIDPPTIIDPITDMAIYITPTAILFFLIVWTRDARAVSTCETCDETFSLAHKVCYYRQRGKRDREIEINERTHRWHEYEGSKVLRCTNPDCGEPEIRDANWDDKTFVQKHYHNI